MCNLREPTDLKEAVMYKAVIRMADGRYVSPFTGTEVKEGSVPKEQTVVSQTPWSWHEVGSLLPTTHWRKRYSHALAEGRTSGFESVNFATHLARGMSHYSGGLGSQNCMTVVELRAEAAPDLPIWRGDALGIGTVSETAVVLAAPLITHIKELGL